jgi:hypothetical protein
MSLPPLPLVLGAQSELLLLLLLALFALPLPLLMLHRTTAAPSRRCNAAGRAAACLKPAAGMLTPDLDIRPAGCMVPRACMFMCLCLAFKKQKMISSVARVCLNTTHRLSQQCARAIENCVYFSTFPRLPEHSGPWHTAARMVTARPA